MPVTANPLRVYQQAHGFQKGQPVRIDVNTGLYALALADTEDNARVVGVVNTYLTPDYFVLSKHGDELIRMTGLVAGLVYFLSDTIPGGVTTTAPAVVRDIYQATTAVRAKVLLNFQNSGTAGGGSGGGGGGDDDDDTLGTVTSVAMTVPTSIMSVTGSPIIDNGTFAVALIAQNANTLFAGPASGSAAIPTFRALVVADIANNLITYAKIQTVSANKVLGSIAGGNVEEITFTSAAREIADDATVGDILNTIGGVPTTRTITAGTGLSGGGDLSANRTINHSNAVSAATKLSANITYDATGHISAATSNVHDDYSTGLLKTIFVGSGRTSSNAYWMFYVSALDKMFGIDFVGSGRLWYMDRVIDAPVAIATFTSKATSHGIYSSVSGLLYLSYATGTISVNATTGAIVTTFTTGTSRSDGGFAIRPSTGIIYCLDSSGTLRKIDPATDTIVASPITLTTTSKVYRGICYDTAADCMYVLCQNGSVDRIALATSVVTNFACHNASGDRGSILCGSDGIIYVVNYVSGGGDVRSLKTIASGTATVANTYVFPIGYTDANASNGGHGMAELGDYLYIGTDITVTPCSMLLVFHKVSAAFVNAVSNLSNAVLRGFPLAGVPAPELKLYAGNGSGNGSGTGAAVIYPIQAP